jgi:ferredoxin
MKLASVCPPDACEGNVSCIAKIISGNVNQSQRRFMTESEIEAGYTVTCVAYPLSDCVLETHQQQVLYSSSLYGPKAQ